MNRPAILAAGLLGGLILSLPLGMALSALAQGVVENTVTSTRVTSFKGNQVGSRIGELVFEGGLVMRSASDTFGGLSGIGFTDNEGLVAMVTDRGSFVSGRLIYDEAGAPLDLVGVTVGPIRNSAGAELPRPFARDAEALAVIWRDGRAAAVRVGFENLTRVADFQLTNGIPGGPAREVAIPDWLTQTRTNQSIESVCIAPPASPIAGSTLIITEGVVDENGDHAATLLGNRDRGPLTYVSHRGSDPSDCAFLPNGDLLVLERGLSLLSFTMRIVRVPAADVQPGAQLMGEVLLEASGEGVDNMEGIATAPGPDGGTRITVISDDNFNDWQRTLLLQFSLPK